MVDTFIRVRLWGPRHFVRIRRGAFERERGGVRGVCAREVVGWCEGESERKGNGVGEGECDDTGPSSPDRTTRAGAVLCPLSTPLSTPAPSMISSSRLLPSSNPKASRSSGREHGSARVGL
jgi:hypothetical protein